MSKAIEKVAPAGVPALATTPAVDIDASDIALPRIKIGQGQSDVVQEGLVKLGAIYSTTGSEDPDPQQLLAAGDDTGLLVHILSLRKGKSVTEGGQLQTYAFDDPDAPADAWTTYDYGVCLPEHDEDLPYKMLFTRTSTPAAKQINLALKKQAGLGPVHELAFRIKTKQRENAKGKFYVYQARLVEADKKHVEIAGRLAELVAAQPSAVERTAGVEPAI